MAARADRPQPRIRARASAGQSRAPLRARPGARLRVRARALVAVDAGSGLGRGPRDPALPELAHRNRRAAAPRSRAAERRAAPRAPHARRRAPPARLQGTDERSTRPALGADARLVARDGRAPREPSGLARTLRVVRSRIERAGGRAPPGARELEERPG